MKAITTINISSSQRRNRRDINLYKDIYTKFNCFFRVMRELHAFYKIRQFLSDLLACLSTIHQI